MGCRNILIIEDDEAVRQSMQDCLEIQGYEPIVATNGQEDIDRLSALDSKPCVILLDMMMPGMNGWQFLDYQRNHGDLAAIPVVICSAFKESAKSVHPSAVLPKPLELKKLVQTVKSFCG
jgi:CheY-like chemotaxis protein